MKKPKAILFDWDNTLVNTWPVIHAALHKTFSEMGREPWTLEMVKKRVSRSMRDAFPEIFGDKWETAADKYQGHFKSLHLKDLQALADAEDTLIYLKDKPVYVAVVSNKKGDNLRLEAEHIGWSPYFKKLIGANDTAHDKPSPVPVYAALEGSKIASGEDVWFIGDSEVDMECAAASGCVGIWYGESPEEPLKHPFKKQARNHKELMALLHSVFG